MNICTHVLARPYPSDSYKAVFVFHLKDNTRVSVTGSYASSPSPLFLSTLPSLSLSPSLPVVATLNAVWSNQLSVFCSTIVVSSYPKSHKLVTVIAVVIC
ncbi:unnamed protein product [Hymenolepis diminuta]|uniref:Uncharacterized protein n=1 Tax=Hymenolepis diminuta TaxID=6216 RepID=A0A564YCZ5_HYMDI|nr:unnamed protein product [Hymenolepis diminuta]